MKNTLTVYPQEHDTLIQKYTHIFLCLLYPATSKFCKENPSKLSVHQNMFTKVIKKLTF